jgi:hypothetical protein
MSMTNMSTSNYCIGGQLGPTMHQTFVYQGDIYNIYILFKKQATWFIKNKFKNKYYF